jgi:Peptidase C39 family
MAGGTSARDVLRACQRNGLSVSVARWTPANLPSANYPLIAHMSTKPSDGGYYILVLGTDNSNVFTVSGPGCFIEAIPIDSFKRYWSGYVIAETDGRWGAFPIIELSAAMLGAYTLWRCILSARNGCLRRAIYARP